MKTRSLLCFILIGLFLLNCKKKEEPSPLIPFQIISPADGAMVRDTVPILFIVDHTLNIRGTECYVDSQLIEAFDSIPANIYFYANRYSKGSSHHYYLRFITNEGAKINSNMVTLIISKLTKPAVSIDFLSKNSLKISWLDNSISETGYRVQRKEGNNNYAMVGELGPNTSSFTDYSIDTTKTYAYVVEAFSSLDKSTSDPINIAFFSNRYHVYQEYGVPSSAEGKIAMTPDLGKIVVTNYWNDSFTVINTITGVMTSLPQDGGSMGLAMSHSGSIFASGGTHDYDLIKIWDLNTLTFLRAFNADAANYALKMNKTDDHLVIGGEPVSIYSTGDGSLIKKFSVTNAYARSAEFSHDESLLLTGGNDNLVKLYNASTGELIRTFTGHSGHVGAAVFSLDETKLISGSYEDRTILIWDKNSGTILKTIPRNSETVSICNGTNGEIIIASQNGTISIMNTVGEMIQEFKDFNTMQAMDFNIAKDVIAGYGSSTTFKVKLFRKFGHWEIL